MPLRSGRRRHCRRASRRLGQPALGQPAPGQPAPGQPAPGHPPPGQFGPMPPGGGYLAHPAPPQPNQWRGAVVTLSVVTGLLLLGGAVLAFLWLSTANELSRTEADLTAQVAELEDRVTAAEQDNDRLAGDLQEATDRADDLQQDLDGTQTANEELREEKSVIRECFLLLGEIGSADAAGDFDRVAELVEESEEVCEEMDTALGL